MENLITVREYARLTTEPVSCDLDCAQVSESAFSWLCDQQAKLRKTGAVLVQLAGRRSLVLDQYVGVMRSPCGTVIEVLPKHTSIGADLAHLRRLLARMIGRALGLKARESAPALVRLFDYPISEWLIRQFIDQLDELIRRGVRFDYNRVEEESRFLRGQLDIGRQLRQPLGRLHLVHIRHDVFLPDRPENRLLKSALSIAREITREPVNWRRANELSEYLEPIPDSTDFDADLAQWSKGRLMASYAGIRPWCELLLRELNPTTVSGAWEGMSLLFPMNKLFERFVEGSLRPKLSSGAKLTSQATSQSLCVHRESPWFVLKPDLLVRHGDCVSVLDAKWKLIDQKKISTNEKYDLAQSDFYQLFAYGERYLNGTGNLFLIYPRTLEFSQPLAPFHFSPQLILWVVPFDLDTEQLVGGDWCAHVSWWQRNWSTNSDEPRAA